MAVNERPLMANQVAVVSKSVHDVVICDKCRAVLAMLDGTVTNRRLSILAVCGHEITSKGQHSLYTVRKSDGYTRKGLCLTDNQGLIL